MASCDTLHGASDHRLHAAVIKLMIEGGDHRIRIGNNGRNPYYATAMPFDGLAYGRSTISGISGAALDHFVTLWYPGIAAGLTPAGYAAARGGLRALINARHGDGSAAIVIAASGSDFEYVGLAAAPARAGPLCALLLVRDEVGSGCIHSAARRYFADRTAVGAAVPSGAPIDARHAANRLADLRIRDPDGWPRSSNDIRADIEQLADAALAAGGRA